jgi:phosphoenolpyruvate synthase/pyruvate phosphate dikinase
VVARQLNKVCVVNCRDLAVLDGRCRIGEHAVAAGDEVSQDGHSGLVYAGRLDVVAERPTAYFEEVERWKARTGSQESTTAS